MAELSEYELRRLDNIKRNEAFLASLGLDNIKPVKESHANSKEIKERKRAASDRRERLQAEPQGPSRRSSRIAGIKTTVVEEEEDGNEDSEDDDDEAVDYEQMPSEPWQLDDADDRIVTGPPLSDAA